MQGHLGGGESLGHDVFDDVGGLLEGHVPVGALLSGQGGEHVVGGVHAPRRAAHADAQARVVARAQVLAEGLQAVMAALAPADLEAQRVRGQVHVVVDDEDARGLDLVEGGERADRPTGGVHVAVGARENHARSRNATGADTEADIGGVRARAVRGEGRAAARGEHVEGQVPDVVSGGGILRAGVT